MKGVSSLSAYALPLLLCILAALLLFSRRARFDRFLKGASDGARTAFSLLPTLVGLMVAVRMLSASGLSDAVAARLSPLLCALGLPAELVPLILLRPFSGSGSNALLLDLFSRYGAESYAGFLASVLMGASDTAVYVLTLYFSRVGVRRTRYAFPAALLTMLFCVAMTLLFGRWSFS